MLTNLPSSSYKTLCNELHNYVTMLFWAFDAKSTRKDMPAFRRNILSLSSWFLPMTLHGIKTQKNNRVIFTAVITSNVTS
jgi:hypothetical protein